MRRFDGIPRDSFPLFLEECEWRFGAKGPERQLRQLDRWAEKHLS